MAVIIFCISFIAACVLNIVAALKMWRWMSTPYIVLDFIRLSILLACHILLMMIFKKQLNLGVLIAICCAGGFFVLFLAYMWSCSVAFFQMTGVVDDYQKLVAATGSPAHERFKSNIAISTITLNVKPSMKEVRNESLASAGMFASDFSEFYRRPRNFRL